MILNALSWVERELDEFVSRKFQVQKPIIVLNSLVDNSGATPESNHNKLVVTMVNLKESQAMQNTQLRPGALKRNPPLFLEMDVLISAVFDDYKESLKLLSAVIGFFHEKSVFTAQNTPELPSNVEKMTFEINNMDMAGLQNLWALNGTHYRPSVLYSVRGIVIDEEILLKEIPVVTGISNK